MTTWDVWLEVEADMLARRLRPVFVLARRYALLDFWAWLAATPPRKRWDRATGKDLDRYLARRAHPGSPASGAWLSTATQRVYASHVAQAYKILARRGVLRRDPLAGYLLPRVGEAPARALDVRTVRRAVAAATDPRRLAMVMLGYEAGLRAGEMARLRVEDVDLGEHPHLRVDGKGGQPGVVALTAELEGFLRGYLAGRGGTGPLLESRRYPGRHLTPNTVSTELGRALRAAGVQARGHQLRHTCATELLRAEEGRNIHAVQGVLRHKRLSTTQRYVLAYNADAEAALRKLPPIRQPAPAARQDLDAGG